MVSKTLQDITRTKEMRESTASRNYEQVVVPHNVTFSADEIYRQAYGAGGGSGGGGSERRKSSSSVGSGYQDPGAPFWNSFTPRQMAGAMSPSSPHAAPMFQAAFMPMGSGGSMHPPPPQPTRGAAQIISIQTVSCLGMDCPPADPARVPSSGQNRAGNPLCPGRRKARATAPFRRCQTHMHHNCD